MTEEVRLEAGDIKIIPARVVCGGATYTVAGITSVKAVADNHLRQWGTFAGALGVLVTFTFGVGLKVGGILFGLCFVVVGGVLAVYGKQTHVVLTTASGESQAFSSRDEKSALAVASAINLAIMKRSEPR